MARLVKVEVVSDTVCPWCYIGRRRLQKAQQMLADRGRKIEMQITYHPFYLDPTLPLAGVDKREHLRRKFGEARMNMILPHMDRVGAADGIRFNHRGKTANTLNSHRLIEYARKRGRQLDMVDRLFRFYFEEAGNIGDLEALAGVAAELGFDREHVLAYLRSDEDRAEMMREIKHFMYERGIHGVPHYTFEVDGRKAEVSGGQAPEVFAEVLEDLVDG